MVSDSTKKTMKKLTNSMKRVTVDLNNRLQRSFGTPVDQQVEIHYRGKPFTFSYDGPIEAISIDAIEGDVLLGMDDENKELKIEPTKKRMDMADAYFLCSCGSNFDVSVPSTIIKDKDKIKEYAFKSRPEMILHDNPSKNHELEFMYAEISTETIPDETKIKNFDKSKINFYKLFSKKTAEIRYLATYDQDLLSEAPQVSYLNTSQGQKKLNTQNMLFMFSILGLFMIFEYLYLQSQTNFYVPHPNNTNLLPWYILIFAIVVMALAMWRIYISVIKKSIVKVIELQSGPFYISNTGVLPVIMINTVVTDIWEHLGKLMNIDDTNARRVEYAMQKWDDTHVTELFGTTQIQAVLLEINKIANSKKELSREDMNYKNQQNEVTTNWRNIIVTAVISLLGYSTILFLLGVL